MSVVVHDRATGSRAAHVVVVGAGVGGLTAAAVLASRGARVTVLERAARVGGKMRQVTVAGRPVDAGPTVLTMRHVFEAVFEAAGERLEDHVSLRASEVIARHARPDGARLDLFADLERSVDAIGRLSGPVDAKGYRAFCDYTAKIHESVEGPFMRAQRPTLTSVLRDQGVRGIASLHAHHATRTVWRSLGDFFFATRGCASSSVATPPTAARRRGSRPPRSTSSPTSSARACGPSTAACTRSRRPLGELAARKGATVRCEAPVREVTVRGGRATGVVLDSGEVIEADAVVVNADTAALSDGRFGAGAAKAWRREASEALALGGDVLHGGQGRGLSPVRHNVFFSSDYEREFDDLDRDSLPQEPTVYACAQDRDDTASAPADGTDRLLLIVNAPARGGRKPFTLSEIDACTQRTRTHLTRLGLTLDWSPERFVTTTPDQFEAM